jgi:tetratricopeptide (TPR) repeat protein
MSLETQLLLQAAEMAGDRGDWADALRLFQELAAAQPDLPGIQRQLGQALRQTGQHAAAEAAYTRALARQPADPALLLELARLCQQTSRPAEALALYRSSLSRLPGQAEAEAAVGPLQATLPAGFTPDISGRLVLARRTRAMGDQPAAAVHYRAVLDILPELDEVRRALAECESTTPPPATTESEPSMLRSQAIKLTQQAAWLESVLEAEAAPWRVGTGPAGQLLPPAALPAEGPIVFPPMLDAYLAGDLHRVASLVPADAPRRAEAEAQLQREVRLRETVGDPTAAAALLPGLPLGISLEDAARQAGDSYFAPEAARLRYLMRRAMAEGQPLPAAAPPMHSLRFETDVLFAMAGRLDVRPLLPLPILTHGGGLLYRMVDNCLASRDDRLGLPLAEMGEAFFQRRGELFKSLQFVLKGAELLQMLGAEGQAPAMERYLRALAVADAPELVLAALRGALTLLPPHERQESPGLARIAGSLARQGPDLIAKSLAELLRIASGVGDPILRRGIDLLSDSLSAREEATIRLPVSALTSPAMFGHMLLHGLHGMPQEEALRRTVHQMAAYASGFTDIQASSQHLAVLLGNGDLDTISAISAYITRSYGAPFRRGDGEAITAVISSRNVGDTLLYLAALAAFSLASGRPVHVLHREERTMLRDFFGAVPGLTFESIPNTQDVPLPLSLNRLAPGNVSLFYEFPWFMARERARLTEPGLERNFLWDKIVKVMLSGAAMLPPRVEIKRPPLYPSVEWNTAARRRFAELGLRRGRTVFLSPLANTLFHLTPSRFNHFRSFWQEAIEIFRAAGFMVVSNSVNNHKAESLFPDAGVPELNLDLRELPAFIAECGYFAGVRSGLCDLLALCGLEGIQSRTLYMRGAEHCIGLAEFGMSEVVADFTQHTPRQLAKGLFGDWLKTRA